MNRINYMYSYTTMTLMDALKLEPTLLDNLVMDNADRTQKFKDEFIAVYNTKSIGAETISLFRVWVENKFNEVKRYYNSRLDIYEKELDGDDGIIATRVVDENIEGSGGSSNDATNSLIDLPRSDTTLERVTNKNVNDSDSSYSDSRERDVTETYTGNVNVIEQREKWLKFVRDIYRDMCNEFSDCFSLIYA